MFRPLSGRVDISPFRRSNVNKSAHYIERKSIKATDQFTDCCINCGLLEKVELRLDWEVVNEGWIERLSVRKPVVLVQMPRDPMGRKDGYGAELLPDRRGYQAAINSLKGRAFLVQIGAGTPVYRLDNIDLDLGNKTTVCDLLDIAAIADGALGYCSFMVPLAESLNKPALLVWSRRGLNSTNPFIKQIIPQKIFNKSSSAAVMDDSSDISASAHTFLEQVRSGATV